MSNSVYSDYYMNVRLDNYQIIKAVQGEVNTRLVTINFMNDNVPYNLVGLFTTINMIKNDGNVIFDDGTIIDPVNGVAQFLITSEMCTNAGTFDVFFKIYGSSPPSELKITGFQLIVEPANNDAGIISSNEFNALQTLIGQVQPAINNLNQTIENANQQVDTLITSTNEAIDIAVTNAKIATINAQDAADLANRTSDILYSSLYIDTTTMELVENLSEFSTGTDFDLTDDGILEVSI